MKLNDRLLQRLFCFVFISLFYSSCLTQLRADILDNWHWRNPLPFSDTMESICFGAGKFVAVGDGGVVHISADGTSWDDGQRVVLTTLNQVVYANGQFVAVGNSGVIVTSTDAVHWTSWNSGTVNDLLAVAFGNGKYVACGLAGQIVVSTDGIHWTPGTEGSVDRSWIAFGSGVFVTADAAEATVRVSSDGQNWIARALPVTVTSSAWLHNVFQVAFGNGTFVAVVTDETGGKYSNPIPRFFWSPDGTNWTQGAYIPFGEAPYTAYTHQFLVFLNGAFHELTQRYPGQPDAIVAISRTTDGTDSSYTYAPTNAPYSTSMAYGNGKYVLVERYGKGWVSTDETNWTATYSGPLDSFSQITKGSNNFVVLGSGAILTSSDGIHFYDNTDAPVGLLTAIDVDGTNYVAIGKSISSVHPGNITYLGEIYTSTNSTNWVRRTSNVQQALTAICHGLGRWVAVGGGGAVITSPNALAWTLRSSGTGNQLNGVAFGNGTYVAVGEVGTVITSSDGASWDVQFSGTTTDLLSVQFFNGQFFATGNAGLILTSTDGVTWFTQNSGTSGVLYNIAYGNGSYVACGYDNVSNPSVADIFLTSSNGTNWQNISQKIPTATPVNSVAYVANSFWVLGQAGIILQSESADGVPRLLGSMFSAGNGMQLKITINPEAAYRVQFRTNLVSDSWHDIWTNANPVSSDTWTDTNAFNRSGGFYRVVAP